MPSSFLSRGHDQQVESSSLACSHLMRLLKASPLGGFGPDGVYLYRIDASCVPGRAWKLREAAFLHRTLVLRSHVRALWLLEGLLLNGALFHLCLGFYQSVLLC